MPDGQPPYEYTKAQLQQLLAVVSQDRIMPYYKALHLERGEPEIAAIWNLLIPIHSVSRDNRAVAR